MTKVYISGPITGVAGLNKALFAEVEEFLTKAGHEAVNPHVLNSEEASWETYLRRDIMALMVCDAIVVLPNWPASKGASLEVHIALELGMPIYRWAEVVHGRTIIP